MRNSQIPSAGKVIVHQGMRPFSEVSAKGLIGKWVPTTAAPPRLSLLGNWEQTSVGPHTLEDPFAQPHCIFGLPDSKRKNKRTEMIWVEVICKFKNHQSWLNQFIFPPPDAQVSFLRSSKALKAIPLARAITVPLICNFKPPTTLSHSGLWYSSAALLRPFVKTQCDRPEAL